MMEPALSDVQYSVTVSHVNLSLRNFEINMHSYYEIVSANACCELFAAKSQLYELNVVTAVAIL